MSGGVVRVTNGTARCIKKCPKPRRDEPLAAYLTRVCAHLLRRKYGVNKGEMFYADIPHKCLFEEALDAASLQDYKLFVIHGQVHFMMITSNRLTEKNRDWRTPQWQRMDVQKPTGIPNNPHLPTPSPALLRDLVKAATRLGRTFPSVRVDFIVLDNARFVFGELTFAHENCKAPLGARTEHDKTTPLDRWAGRLVALRHPEVDIDPPECILHDVLFDPKGTKPTPK